jgi:type II secretory pathway pseudopilin PulG
VRFTSDEGGFGLIELLIAMTVMAIAIFAIVAGFSSGIIAVNRASQVSTAGTLADKQMEAYRALTYPDIGLASTPSPPIDALYTGDPAYNPAWPTPTPASCTASTPTCMPVRTPASGLTAPDQRSYRLDTYIAWSCAVGTLTPGSPPTCAGTPPARASKQITIVVRDYTTPSTPRILFRETSTFDQAT